MNTVAAAFLVLVLIAMFVNFRRGTLGQWARAKFLNDPGS